MVGFDDVGLHGVHFLAVDIRPGVLRALHGAGAQRVVDVGEGDLLGGGTHRAELRFEYRGRLDAEAQPRRITRQAQHAGSRKLLHAVVPVRQAGDVLVFHRAQQLLALGALLKAVDGIDVVEQERQVENLQLLGVLLELRQRRGEQLHFVVAQRFQFRGITEQRRIGVYLHADLAGQAFLREAFEHQRTLALGGILGHYVRELDDDGLCLGEGAGGGQHEPGKGNDRLHERLFILVGWQCIHADRPRGRFSAFSRSLCQR